MTRPASNAPEVAARLRAAAAAVRAELAAELRLQAGKVESVMRVEAPKFRTVLTNSVQAEQTGPLEYVVRPHTDYAVFVLRGRKPGKGLPRFGSPEAFQATAWLQSKLQAARRAVNPRYRPGRAGSKRRTAEDQELADRYFAWSRHVKLRGIKPNDYVGRTREQTTEAVHTGLAAAVRRGLQAHLKGGAA